MFINQISIFVENKQGRLSDIINLLAEANINLRAVSIGDTADFGILRIIVDKPKEAEAALKKASMTMSINQVIAMSLDDVPGGFAKAVKVLAENEISIEYMYAFNGGQSGKASIVVRVNDNERAVEVLSGNNIKVLSEAEMQ